MMARIARRWTTFYRRAEYVMMRAGPDKKMNDIGGCLAERLPRFAGRGASLSGRAAARRQAGTAKARGDSG
jgi:hypothetical protein